MKGRQTSRANYSLCFPKKLYCREDFWKNQFSSIVLSGFGSPLLLADFSARNDESHCNSLIVSEPLDYDEGVLSLQQVSRNM